MGRVRHNYLLFILSLFVLLLLLPSAFALFVDDSTTSQILYDCGTLNTANAVYTMNQSSNSTVTCLNVTANNVTINMNGFNITGDDGANDYGLVVSGYNETTLRDGYIYDFGRGVFLSSSFVSSINNLTLISNLNYGIRLESSVNSTISSNTVSATSGPGISLFASTFNNVTGNNASGQLTTAGDGLEIESGSNDTSVLDNIVDANTGFGLSVAASHNNTFSRNTFNNNTKNGVNINSAEDNSFTSNNASNGTSSGIELYSSHNNSFVGNHFDGNGKGGGANAGLYLSSSMRNIFVNNTVDLTEQTYGMGLSSSSGNIFVSNTFISSGDNSIDMSSSHNNTFTSNTISSGTYDGVYLSSSKNNTFTSNIITLNGGEGIYPGSNSNFNTFTSNNVTANKGNGIFVSSSHNNSFTANTVSANNKSGLKIESGQNNTYTNDTSEGNLEWDFLSLTSSLRNVVTDLDIGGTVISFTSQDIGLKNASSPGASPGAYMSIGKFVNITNNSASSFVLLNISYSEAIGSSIDNESTLVIMRYNGSWETNTSTFSNLFGVTIAQNRVFANITSFSIFGAFGKSVMGTVNITAPSNGSIHKSDFSVNVSVTNAIAVYFRYENSTSNGSWTPMNKSSATEWNGTFEVANLSGNYTIRVNATDGFNSDSNATVNVTIDTVIPVLSFSCSPTSVSSGQTITCTCSATDTLDPSPAVSFTANPTTSSAGTQDTTCTATDSAGNSATATVSYTVTSSGGGGSAGSSGGVSNQVQGQYKKKVWASINAGETATVRIETGKIGVTGLSFEVDATALGAWVKVERKQSTPSGIQSFNGEMYRIIEITERNLDQVISAPITITFNVEGVWLESNDLSEEDIRLYRYNRGEWRELETFAGEEEDGFIQYTAQSPGFSYFVIGGVLPSGEVEPDGPIQEPEISLLPPPLPDETEGKGDLDESKIPSSGSEIFPSSRPFLWLWLVVWVVTLVLAVAAILKRRGKTLSDEEVPERVRNAVVRWRQRGLDDNTIRKRLISGGWDPEAVESLIMGK